jgi:hypothetical protein
MCVWMQVSLLIVDNSSLVRRNGADDGVLPEAVQADPKTAGGWRRPYFVLQGTFNLSHTAL